MAPPSRLIAVESGSFEAQVQSTDLSTFKDVIEDPTEWLRAKVKGQDVRLWVEQNVDRGREIYLGVSFTNNILKYRRIKHEWVEKEDEGYKSCLGDHEIGWLTEEKYRCDSSEIIVVELSPERDYCTLSGSLKE